MLEFIQKKGLIITLAISAIIIALFFLTGQNVGLILNGAYFLLIVALFLAIVLPVFSALKEPKILLKAGIGLVAIAIFFLIGYSVSNEYVLASGKQTGFVEVAGAKFSGGILNATYILLVVAILTVFAGPIIKKINN